MSQGNEHLGVRAELRALRTLVERSIASAPGLALVNTLLVFAIAGTQIATVALGKMLVDRAALGEWSGAGKVAAALGASASVTSLLHSLQAAARDPFEDRVDAGVKAHLIELTAQPPGLELHERPDLQDRLALLQGSSWRISQALGNFLSFFTLALSIGGFTVLLAAAHPALILLLAPAALSRVLASRSVAITRRVEEATAERSRMATHLFWLCSTAPPGKELRVFGLAPEILSRQASLRREVHAEQNRADAKASVLTALAVVPFALSLGVAVGFTLWLALNGRATAGDLFLVISQGSIIGAFLDALTGSFRNLSQGLVVMDRYRWLMSYAATASAGSPDPVPVPAALQSGIALRNVSFQYPGTESPALLDVSLDLPAGSTVALVGENGAGKSTIVKLLTGMYQPTSGTVEVDGTNLCRFAVAEWRSRCTAAFQDHTRWELFVREVIGLGELSRLDDDAALNAALHRAGVDELSAMLDNGLDTPLGRSMPGGCELSGGQWQKLSLARTMLREVPLLVVLDEPTAALDPTAEHTLFERYGDLSRGSTVGAVTVLVSHRFSTVRNADNIIVLSGGRTVEHGNHEQLMSNGGLYAELYAMQAAHYK